MARRAKARAATLAPSTKARVLALRPRRQSQVAFVRRRLVASPAAKVLGVGRFDPTLVDDLIRRGADIVDHRPANRAANILADLTVDGAALAGPYDLIVAQEPGFASGDPYSLARILAEATARGGSLAIVTESDGGLESAFRSIRGTTVIARPTGVAVGLEVRLQ